MLNTVSTAFHYNSLKFNQIKISDIVVQCSSAMYLIIIMLVVATKVHRRRPGLVLGWVTTREDQAQ